MIADILDQHGIFKETELLTQNTELNMMTRPTNNHFMKQLKLLQGYANHQQYGIRCVIDIIIYTENTGSETNIKSN